MHAVKCELILIKKQIFKQKEKKNYDFIFLSNCTCVLIVWNCSTRRKKLPKLN
jgi:hypothetical protein